VTGWSILAVDDEPLGLGELVRLLKQDARVDDVASARDGIEALRALRETRYDAVFLDVNMPGLDGVELAAVLSGQLHPPVIVFVTAHEHRAAEAFGLDAADYVLKPIRPERIVEALGRVERRLASGPPSDTTDALAMLSIDDGRRKYFIRREDVLFAESHRDYVHLHTRGAEAGTHVLRMPLSTMEEHWRDHGFMRIHRSYLIALRYVSEVARDPLGGTVVRVAGHDLPVSRRQSASLLQRVNELSRRGELGGPS